MSKTVKGFGVRNQGRKKIRSDLNGTYNGRDWYLRSDGSELFWWTIGKMSGYAGPTLADVLRAIKKASIRQTKFETEFGELKEEQLKVLDFLAKWERRALQGRLTIKGPLGKGEKTYYKVMVSEL